MKKNIMALLITVSMLSITACGKQETTATTESISTTVEPTQVETTVTEENVTTETEAEKTTTSNGNGKDTITETSKIPESNGWTDYKKTADYYIASGQATESAMHVLNPDIYGTETAGKGTGDVPYDFIDASVDIRMMKVTTTKGYPIEAWYYVEAGTVQFIYTGEVSPGGAWYTNMDSDDVLDAYFNYEKSILDITHEQKIQILGEPTMTAEEVIAALQ